jgi:hypothetical protein
MNTKSLVIASLMGAIAAILQSAGNWLPGVGYVISAFSTLPIILLCFTTPFRYACMGFGLACLLLLVIEPTEVFVFPFTTGLLGLCLGKGMSGFKHRISMVLSAAIPLWFGILFLLYVVQFPVLGPDVSSTFNLVTTVGIMIFCMVYSLIWEEAVRWIIRKYFKHLLTKS